MKVRLSRESRSQVYVENVPVAAIPRRPDLRSVCQIKAMSTGENLAIAPASRISGLSVGPQAMVGSAPEGASRVSSTVCQWCRCLGLTNETRLVKQALGLML